MKYKIGNLEYNLNSNKVKIPKELDSENRGSGRTTRIVMRAALSMLNGENVILIAASIWHTRSIMELLLNILKGAKIEIEVSEIERKVKIICNETVALITTSENFECVKRGLKNFTVYRDHFTGDFS